jgi:hypothetical protein
MQYWGLEKGIWRKGQERSWLCEVGKARTKTFPLDATRIRET